MVVQVVIAVEGLRQAEDQAVEHRERTMQPGSREERRVHEVVSDALEIRAVEEDGENRRRYHAPPGQPIEHQRRADDHGEFRQCQTDEPRVLRRVREDASVRRRSRTSGWATARSARSDQRDHVVGSRLSATAANPSSR